MEAFFIHLTTVTGVSTVVEKDYCHNLANFTMTHEEILRNHGGVNPFCMGGTRAPARDPPRAPTIPLQSHLTLPHAPSRHPPFLTPP